MRRAWMLMGLSLSASVALSSSAAGPASSYAKAPEWQLVQGRCLLCHSGDYVAQQRLTQPQWQKEVEKMRKFGSPLTDDEVKTLVAYLSKTFTPDLPVDKPPRAKPPVARR